MTDPREALWGDGGLFDQISAVVDGLRAERNAAIAALAAVRWICLASGREFQERYGKPGSGDDRLGQILETVGWLTPDEAAPGGVASTEPSPAAHAFVPHSGGIPKDRCAFVLDEDEQMVKPCALPRRDPVHQQRASEPTVEHCGPGCSEMHRYTASCVLRATNVQRAAAGGLTEEDAPPPTPTELQDPVGVGVQPAVTWDALIIAAGRTRDLAKNGEHWRNWNRFAEELYEAQRAALADIPKETP
jgi:hypothetical protein